MSAADDVLLTSTLQIAVPVEIARIATLPDSERLALAAECGQHIASHGDDILFRAKKKGETAAAFARLATGLACLAYQPGGVTFAGLHFEATRGEA